MIDVEDDDGRAEVGALGCTCLGIMLLLPAMWAYMAAWGFAGPERSFWVELRYGVQQSDMLVYLCPLEKHGYHFAVVFLLAGVLFGLGSYIRQAANPKRIGYRFLIPLGLALLPLAHVYVFPPDTSAAAIVQFERELTPPELKRLSELLGPASIDAWATFHPSMPSSRELSKFEELKSTKKHEDVGQRYFTMRGNSFRRRREIGAALGEFLRAQTEKFAHDMGFAPIRSEDVNLREEFIEK